ncbi:hypothetical protein [Endozoicomonas sp. 8E]|uniref:hypothetical protein n=1 Tax=Endozoicomonas sp. 8E TaxID=3035692 RepID=UPI0029391E60|nr:hypothetical protein [Endozoicomonas sp. 8E]WOG29613.1 hypothetical protein P6910_08155 [Endozoicomonas sp. 8E]
MTNAHPKVSSLAVAIAISSSIISTQALADRKLQTKSVNILANKQAEYIHSEVMVRPTLGPDGQPIPKCFTTTYPYRVQDRVDFDLPTVSFTAVLYRIDGGVASVDLFETDENNVAKKYTKVLKMGDEGIFRFTHNLEETKLVIEVRAGMTDQDSVKAFRARSFLLSDMEETLTKVTNPGRLYELLKAVNDRAGNLGTSDHYVALATIEVEKVEVNGRTFMRLIASSDQPPELKSLGQSLFVNDEALLAAATSAYIQVHVLGKDIQQQALNELLAQSKPVGYVVHVGDDAQVSPVPAGYPKLEVAEVPGEVIVFRGQKPNPNDTAFVEKLHNLWQEAESNNLAPALSTKINRFKVRSYRYVIRSRQMAVLEEFAARHAAEVSESQPPTLTNEDKQSASALAFYEYLHQALASASQDRATTGIEFEFTLENIRAASSVITPTWLQIQLTKHFSFNPLLRDLLSNQNVVQDIMGLVPIIDESPPDVSYDNDRFAFKVLSNMAGQLIEGEGKLTEQLKREGKLTQVSNHLKIMLGKATAIEKQKLIVLQLKYQAEHDIREYLDVTDKELSPLRKLRQKVDAIPELEKQIRNARAEATKARNARLAKELGIKNWDDSQLPEKQTRLISIKIHEINQALLARGPATGRPEGGSAETTPAALQHQSTRTEAEIKASYATIAALLNLQDFDSNADIDVQLDQLLWRIALLNTQLQGKHELNLQQKSLFDRFQSLNTQGHTLDEDQQHLLQKIQALNAQCCSEEPDVKTGQDGLALILGIRLDDSTMEEHPALKTAMYKRFRSLEYLDEELKDIRTPGHPRVMPVILEKLSDVEKVLKIDDLISQEDVYYRRNAISEAIQARLAKVRQREEEVAQKLLNTAEEILNIEVNNEDHKTARLARVRTKLDSADVTESMVDEIEDSLRKEDITFWSKIGNTKLQDLQRSLDFYVEEMNSVARIRLISTLKIVEGKLHIFYFVHEEADERGTAFVAKLANDLGVELRRKAHLPENRDVIKNKILALMTEVDQACDNVDVRRNEDVRRSRNNEIAHQLSIDSYKDDAAIDDQNILIKEKLQELYEEVPKAGVTTADEHITAINAELDRQMARLGPKPRYVLDRELASARQTLQKAESKLAAVHRRLIAVDGKHVLFAGRPANLRDLLDEENLALNQAMKQIQTELGLPAVDEQPSEERLRDFSLFLWGHSEEIQGEILDELKDRTGLSILIKDDIGSLENVVYCIAIPYTESHIQNEDNEALGELFLTRRKYVQIREFVSQHNIKISNLVNAQIQRWSAKEKLEHKEKEMIDLGDIDQKAKTLHMNEMDRLGLILKQASDAVSKAHKALVDHEAALDATEEAAGLKPDSSDTCEHRISALVKIYLQLGGYDGFGGKIHELLQEKIRLRSQIGARKADIERMKEVLRAAEEAVENDGGPFQFSPKQVNVLADMDTFTQQHPLRQQALDAALGLAESAVKSGKTVPCLTTFDFNDQFAPIRLQALVEDDLTFNQASRIVAVFKSLKSSFPLYPVEPLEDQPQNVIEQVQALADRARNEMKTGAPQYDDEIRGIGKRAIHFVEHGPGDLKSFPEYFATHSASGNKIIALLREGLINKIELGNYIKAVRRMDGYQTVDEFEHFLGYQRGVNLPDFKAFVQSLSDKGVDEFVQSVFIPVTATGPAGMKESVAGMKEYAAAVIANYVLDDIAFDNGRRTAAFLADVQDTLTPYANAAGLSESDLIKIIHDTLMKAHAAAVEQQLNEYWAKPSAFLVQAVTWYFSSYKPLLATRTAWQATALSLSNMSFLYLLDLTNRGDYLHRMLTPFQHWLEHYAVDLDRTSQYACHSGIEQISEVGGLVMPLGKAASSVILLRTGSMLFARQYNANSQMYRSISRLVPEIVKSMGSGQGVQVPLLHRATPQKVKTLASAAAGLVLGPVAGFGTYAHGLLSGFTYAQTFGFALASSLTFDFFMNDNKMLTQWLGGPLGRSLDKVNRWLGVGETDDKYVKRTATAAPQGFRETDQEYANRVKANNTMYGWMRHENYLQFREHRGRTMKLFENGWEKYFRENVPKWSFSHAESIPYFYTLGVFFEWQKGDDQKDHGHDKRNYHQSSFPSETSRSP